ncbi:MAG TPA: phosphatidylserine/phosphatidylglycerophosphate/cardiolipin synthase family protein [Ktedonobacteraceae bacterium]|nr:phosphatidylserine/phosphatidylglycerophosphate/cardiolipin synthase family protein [Ktedonobacteraceae bacterium]
MINTRMIRRLLTWSLALFFAAQALIISVLLVIDAWRKRYHSQGRFPRSHSTPVGIGNSEMRLYTYGEDLYAAMLQAIRQAREHIVVETFIWKDDPIGRQFKQELSRAAERGVDVSIIFDSFANLVIPRCFKRFPAALHVLEYPLFSWPWHPFHLRSYARDHRKLLVVDGYTAFVGGYNIGSLYATEWRDTHACITGPDAWELENVFINFWNTHRSRRLPALTERGTRDWDPHINVHRNDPQLLIFPIRTTYLEAIDRARHHIYLTHAYFIPDRIILRALLAAARRGVDVRILLPATSNHVLADWLARGYYMKCLQSGIRLLLYQHAMVHAKTATIDGAWSTVGTANMDRLSMVGNFEVNVEVYDEVLARQMEDIFMKDASNTHELTLEEWRRRSLLEKLAETLLLPLRPLL